MSSPNHSNTSLANSNSASGVSIKLGVRSTPYCISRSLSAPSVRPTARKAPDTVLTIALDSPCSKFAKLPSPSTLSTKFATAVCAEALASGEKIRTNAPTVAAIASPTARAGSRAVAPATIELRPAPILVIAAPVFNAVSAVPIAHAILRAINPPININDVLPMAAFNPNLMAAMGAAHNSLGFIKSEIAKAAAIPLAIVSAMLPVPVSP